MPPKALLKHEKKSDQSSSPLQPNGEVGSKSIMSSTHELWVGIDKLIRAAPASPGQKVSMAPSASAGSRCSQEYRCRQLQDSFTPRKPRSIWSAINIRRANELSELGLMHPAGLAAFEKRDGERSAIYAYEQGEKRRNCRQLLKRNSVGTSGSLEILSVPTPLVPANLYLLGD